MAGARPVSFWRPGPSCGHDHDDIEIGNRRPGFGRRFLETYEPLRSPLYRYCRYLTRSPWDAEDLAQDALARAFVTLARMNGQEPANPRAWLFRIASNLWIDATRRHREVRSGARASGRRRRAAGAA